ncbi:hypothetical protein [Glutamicibacter sp. FBE19]|uniref:hypothetical protein n=1 Tax=Glutamicibacter sp. FBE19 TaxID=2761534 RepID=UPI0018966899|nr:hypothetical protein [Glutamicibacter sp. FBE19]MBF6672097.1 hypothetical protein [Glutamicibacter sp. FBE19]
MKATFSTWYLTAIIATGLAFFALALSAYATGQQALIFIGMGIFMVTTMTMASLFAQRQRKALALDSK